MQTKRNQYFNGIQAVTCISTCMQSLSPPLRDKIFKTTLAIHAIFKIDQSQNIFIFNYMSSARKKNKLFLTKEKGRVEANALTFNAII